MLQHHAPLLVADPSRTPSPDTVTPKGLVTPGLGVLYVLSAGDLGGLRNLPGPKGNPTVGDVLPASVTKVWDADSGIVNLKVICDGAADYWATQRGFCAPWSDGGSHYVLAGNWFTVRELPLLKAPDHGGRQRMDEASAMGRTG